MGKSPVGPVILVKRTPIMKGGIVSTRIDDAPVYVEDVVRMTGSVIPEDTEVSGSEDTESLESEDLESMKKNNIESNKITGSDSSYPTGVESRNSKGVDPIDMSMSSLRTTGGDRTTPGKRSPRHSFPLWK